MSCHLCAELQILTIHKEKLFTKILEFNGQHYDRGSKLMENLFHAKELWNLVKVGVEELVDDTILADA